MHSRDSELLMKLDFRHSKLLANPVHLLAVHISKQYGQIGQYVQWRYYYAVFKIYLCDTAIYARPTLNTGGSRVSIQHHNDWRAYCYYDSLENECAVGERYLFKKSINKEKRLTSWRTKVRLNHSL